MSIPNLELAFFTDDLTAITCTTERARGAMECTLRKELGRTSRWAERNKHGAQRREGEVRAVLAPSSRAACGRTRERPAWWRIASRDRRGGFDPAIARGGWQARGCFAVTKTRLMEVESVSATTWGRNVKYRVRCPRPSLGPPTPLRGSGALQHSFAVGAGAPGEVPHPRRRRHRWRSRQGLSGGC
ncbi:uncharacterized protein Tco025E_09651 [Trypanosoma conorhini]|uniref:Uncharacterized protein n=1 Tax=Trypanosoma conorhini TaxID=83891 RepID=A0A3R7JTW9_9TRYP|nr:uncharacterized protein Tco025E_09651 [Trypanosoma conorhini]RNE96774.1 hypothetical protein Tco025E_09651 [Trypanosoma conorhini]